MSTALTASQQEAPTLRPKTREPKAYSRTRRVAFCSYFSNAGSSTRCVEIARAFRERVQRERGGGAGGGSQDACAYDIRLFSYATAEGSTSYESFARSAGIKIEHFRSSEEDVEVVMDDDLWSSMLRSERHGMKGGFFPPPYEDRALPYLRAVIDSLRRFEPDAIVQGAFPEVSIAARILGVPTVRFGPIPADPAWRRKNFAFGVSPTPKDGESNVEGSESRAATGFSDPSTWSMFRAAVECGFDGSPKELHAADEYLVCDLPSLYEGQELPGNNLLVGPLFAQSSRGDAAVPQEVAAILSDQEEGAKGQTKVFVTMASSGDAASLLEAAQACADGGFRAIIAAPKSVLTSSDVAGHLGGVLPDSIAVTDRFLPSRSVAEKVDVVVCHGGQGTVQSALSSGTPLVGCPMQWEQRYNLRMVEKKGAGVYLEHDEWTAENVLRAIERVLKEPAFKSVAVVMAAEINSLDSRTNAAEAILDFMERNVQA